MKLPRKCTELDLHLAKLSCEEILLRSVLRQCGDTRKIQVEYFQKLRRRLLQILLNTIPELAVVVRNQFGVYTDVKVTSMLQ